MVFSRYSNGMTACNSKQKNPPFIVMNVNTVLCLFWLSSALLNQTWCSDVGLMRARVLYCEIKVLVAALLRIQPFQDVNSMSTGVRNEVPHRRAVFFVEFQ